MFNVKFIGLLLVLSSVMNATLALTKLTNCKAILDDGRVVDLTSLDNPNNPR